MECDDDGSEQARAARGRGIKRKLGTGAPGVVRLAFTTAVPGAALARAPLAPPSPPAPRPPHHEPPFMSNMDEISYWIYTKRAPCLFNYDNILKKQSEQPHCSTAKPPSVKSEDQEPSPKKKKLLDEDSVSSEKQQNVYFKTPQVQKPAPNSCKSDRADSDVDFNINSSSGPKKCKSMKLQKSPTRVPKKKKVSTSTPKVVQLRRSLRTAQQKWNNSNLNSSFEIFNASIVNGKQDAVEEDKRSDKVVTNNQSKSKVILSRKGTNDIVPNGQFEDLSDVSGFTANYIRSTKIHSSKRPQKLRNQNTRTLTKHSKQRVQCDKIIMCVNKSVNTGFPDTTALNCSTDSSQNAIKLVTVKSQEQSTRVNKSTSVLKFIETKLEGNNNTSKNNKRESKNKLNISFQSRSSGASRYPRRHKNNTETLEPNCSTNIALSKPNATSRRYNMRKGTLNVNRKENSEEKVVSRTRSGRRKGLKLDVEETDASVLQLNSSMEQVSSSPAVNVACPNTKSTREDTAPSRCLRSRTVNRDKVGQFYKESSSEESNKKLSGGMPCALEQSTPKCVRKVKKSAGRTGQSMSRDSLREKTGFAACFSDSDSDSAPLKQHKFFC